MLGLKTYYPTLTEVKAGQTGKGLLIEHDGHIMANSDMISQIKEDIAHHNEFIIPDHFMVSAIFQKYGVKNANGRVYPEAILKREVEKYINERVANRSSIGALDHPSSSTISGHDVSHVITKLEWIGKTLIGEMEIHTTPGFKRYGVASTSGDLVANMLINNIQIGVSSRAVGSVEQKLGVLVVGDDLELLAWDVVAEPSTPGAFIANSREELQQYAEADETKQGKPFVNEKIEKIKEILF